MSGGKVGIYTIPNTITNVASTAFVNCATLTNITIPGSVTNIGYQAFALCSRLSSVTISNGVKNIGSGAFQDCSSLTNITIPGSVTNIGSAPFLDCTSLEAITVDAQNANDSSSEGILFDKDQRTLVEYPGGKMAGSYTIQCVACHFIVGDKAHWGRRRYVSLADLQVNPIIWNARDRQHESCGRVAACHKRDVDPVSGARCNLCHAEKNVF